MQDPAINSKEVLQVVDPEVYFLQKMALAKIISLIFTIHTLF